MSALSYLSNCTLIDKTHFDPASIVRAGCPCKHMPYVRISAHDEARTKRTHDLAMMVLSHQSKHTLDLAPIHDELYLQSLKIQGSGTSNILVTKLSFNCSIIDETGQEHLDYVCFDLRIPGMKTSTESVFSYDSMEKAYGGKNQLYSAISHFYQEGLKIANKNGIKHGHTPDYSGTNSSHDQYIRHTEQLLVAYLALPTAAQMLSNRLRAEIRGKYPKAKAAVIYNMGIHMHSTKTCCGPCEYALLGLSNYENQLMQTGVTLGFLANFKLASIAPSEVLNFQFDNDYPFKALVTVSANEADAHHKKLPTYTQENMALNKPIIPFTIDTDSSDAFQYIFTTVFNREYDVRKLSSISNLEDITVGISGSKSSKGSPGTINKVQKHRDQSLDDIAENIQSLKF
jgi:hypothetical protein